MRYTRIEIEGDNGNFATLGRKRGSDYIDVEVVTPTGPWKHQVAAGDAAGRRALAADIQAKLGREVRPYEAALELLAL